MPAMKVFVLMDHVCEGDILVGIFSTREKAQVVIDSAPRFTYEGPEICECDLDSMYYPPYGI